MANGYKKIAINPPEGEDVARYSVTSNEQDVFKIYIFRFLLPEIFKGILLIIPILFCGNVISRVFDWLIKALCEYSETLVEHIGDWSLRGLTTLVLIFYLIFFIVTTVIKGINLKKEAKKVADNGSIEEYGFYEGGYLYSNQKDLVRIDWDDVLFVLSTKKGLYLYPRKVSVFQYIPARYFCCEYGKLQKTIKNALKMRFFSFADLGRERQSQYDNPARKVTVYIPTQPPVSKIKAELDMRDLTSLKKMWSHQIKGKYHTGLFLCVTLIICLAVCLGIFIVSKQSLFLSISLVLLGILLLYTVFLLLNNILCGYFLLVNRPNYKAQVTYSFYEDEMLVIYGQGVSIVRYNDLHTIFEDLEGMAFLFSKKKLLFIPERYMKSASGVAISHQLKRKYLSTVGSKQRHEHTLPRKAKKHKVNAFDFD